MKNYIDYLDTLSKKQLMLLLARQRQEQTEGISIVGMGCRFPGDINDPETFWNTLCQSRIVPATFHDSPCFSNGQPRWNFSAEDLLVLKDMLHPGRYLNNIDLFDAEYFGYQADEIDFMDPQQRLLLEVTVQALADANLTRAQIQKKSVGIFVGMSFVEYPLASLRNGIDAELLSPQLLNGSSLSAASGRLGLMLGVNGPAMTLDTASSSALTAVHLAIQSLRRRECDIAIIGASHLQLSPVTSVILAKAGLTSKTGNSLPFTNNSNGFVRSEGCGVVILKRCHDAKDDLPYAMIRGSAVNQHGDRLALTATSSLGQQSVIRKALKNADIQAKDVQYVEAQANGLGIGGVVEIESLAKSYERDSAKSEPLYVGSCKANLGYLEIASGVASLIKVALSLSHGQLTPQIGADDLDSTISWKNMSLKFATRLTPWPESKKRLAGISSFGINGINAHLLVEGISSSNDSILTDSRQYENEQHLLVLSSHSLVSFNASALRLYQYLSKKQNWKYEAVCRTLIEGRDRLKIRQATVISNREELLDVLLYWSELHLSKEELNIDSNAAGTLLNFSIALQLHDLNEQQLRRSLEYSQSPGLTLLKVCTNRYLETMLLPSIDNLVDYTENLPEGTELAFILGWLEVFSTVGLTITRADISGKYRHQFVKVITDEINPENVIEQWKSNITADVSVNTSINWVVETSEINYLLTRNGGGDNCRIIRFEDIDSDNWLSLVAEHYISGEDITLSALTEHQETKLIRLPGPVLIGKRYWLKQFQWY